MRDFQTLKESVQALMPKINFPEDSQIVFLNALDQIIADAASAKQLDMCLSCYDETTDCNYVQMLSDMKQLCEPLGIHEYTGNTLLFLCMADKLRQRYSERSLPEHIFYDSMKDLTYKLEECRLVRNILGTFVPKWYPGFFKLTRFALGRLQFEIVAFKEDYVVDGVQLPAGSKAINLHIPRTGTRLYHDLVLEAYDLAAAFYKDVFGDDPIVFTCGSWMLYPWIRTVLAPSSNMAAFYDDFTIVSWGEYEDYNQVWRLFDCTYTGDPDQLPQDSSLRRAFVQRIKQGEKIGWGKGVFIYRKS